MSARLVYTSSAEEGVIGIFMCIYKHLHALEFDFSMLSAPMEIVQFRHWVKTHGISYSICKK